MKIALLLTLLGLLPLSAESWEAGLFVGSQRYNAMTGSLDGTSLSVSVRSKTIYGFRLGYDLADLGPCTLQLTGAYLPQVASDFNEIISQPGLGSTTYTAQFKSQQSIVGAMFNFKLPVALGLGAEDRFERSSLGYSGKWMSQNDARPWIRARATYAIPAPKLKPFIGLEAAIPLLKANHVFGPDDYPEVKDLAPMTQGGLTVGVRF